MAKNTQEAEVIVTMNGQAAKKAVAELAQEYERLQKEALEAYKAGNDALGKKLDAQAQKLMKDIEITRHETKKFADVMKNINGASLKELRSAAKQLQSEINKLAPGTQAFIEKSKQLQQVNTRIRQLTNEFKGLVVEEKQATFSLKGLADGFNKYFGMVTAGIAAVTGVSMAFRKAAEDAARLDDVYADVMKTTGLLHEEVQGLDEELMKIDTRTSREQLLLLARDAGKLGIQGKENILGFVRAADQIQVALGEDLGEGAIRNLGKIADVLGYTQSMGIEKSLLSIASSINAVGQASTASEAYLVDFTQRLAGVAAQTGISAANIIGFASGLDQSAMKVEMASTAFQKFLMKLYEDPAKFAAYANLEVGKFTDLLKNDANQAVITILKALKDQDGFASLVPIFKDMGLDGARAVSVLAAMATNINAVTDAQALANEEFAKATSVTEEYNTKNNNMQANLEKARKEFQNASIALGQSLNPVMLKSTKLTTHLIKALATYGKEIKTVIIVIAALTVALKAKAIWMKAVAVWNATLRTGSLALAAAQALLTGNVTRAAAAWAMMNTAMKASVFGVVTAAIAGLIIALQRLNKKREETNLLQEKALELDKKIENAGAKEIAQVKHLNDVVHDQMRSYYERNKALEELKKLVPEYQASLTKEGELINDNTEALDNYIQKIKQAALEKLMAEEIADLAQRETEAKMAKESHQKSLDEAQNTYSGDAYMGHTANEGMVGVMEELLAADEVVLNGIAEERQQLTDKLNRMIAAGDLTIDAGGGGGGGGGGDGGDDKDPAKRYQQALKNLEQRQREEMNILNQSYFDKKITAEEHEQQLQDITMKYLQEKLKLAEENGKDTTQIEAAILSEKIKTRKASYEEELKLLETRQKNEERKLEQAKINGTISEEDYNKELLNIKVNYLQRRLEKVKEYGQDEEAAMQALLDAEYEAAKLAMEQVAKLRKEAQDVKDSLRSPSQVRDDNKKTELEKLEQLHKAMLLSDEEYGKKAKAIEKKYAEEGLKEKLSAVEKYISQVNSIMSEASNFVSALKDAESAKLEAQYQADLTAAGDNAEKKAEIEAQYEEDKLELSKKYADTEMVINIAKTIAAGALAAIQAFAQLGPIAGGIMAAIIAATTAAEVYTIVQQRNAIKNSSVSSSSSSSVSTGQRTMTGLAEGGYTEDHTTVTTVGERGREWVAPAWMVRQNPVTFSNLERYRKSGSHGQIGSVSRGFADGGFTPGNGGGPSGAMPTQIDIETAVEAAIRRSMADGAIRAYLVRKDLTELDAQDERFKKQTAR